MDLVSKNKITYDKVKTIFNGKTIITVNIIASEKPSDNRTKLLKTFLDLGEVFNGIVYSLKMFDDKNEIVRLKIKADDKQSKLETQNGPLELDKEKEPKFEESITERAKLIKQKSDWQPDTTDMSDLESEESAAQRRNQHQAKCVVDYQFL